ncbi:hypothetical protein [Serinicoccus marinus]|uniref:hypothetical protein n=1 Tax=Serinicoccus marinus TaxID=247333 RepID=UPI0003B5C427|nr:hypothetical protein [Serinicoccus marinus]
MEQELRRSGGAEPTVTGLAAVHAFCPLVARSPAGQGGRRTGRCPAAEQEAARQVEQSQPAPVQPGPVQCWDDDGWGECDDDWDDDFDGTTTDARWPHLV